MRTASNCARAPTVPSLSLLHTAGGPVWRPSIPLFRVSEAEIGDRKFRMAQGACELCSNCDGAGASGNETRLRSTSSRKASTAWAQMGRPAGTLLGGGCRAQGPLFYQKATRRLHSIAHTGMCIRPPVPRATHAHPHGAHRTYTTPTPHQR